jgi:hypothetical protein
MRSGNQLEERACIQTPGLRARVGIRDRSHERGTKCPAWIVLHPSRAEHGRKKLAGYAPVRGRATDACENARDFLIGTPLREGKRGS